MTNLEQTRQLVQDVDGFLSHREGEALYRLAAACQDGVIVEIGSWKGKSTIWLGRGSQQGGRNRIFAIDHHVGSKEHQQKDTEVWTFKEFERNIEKAGVTELITPLVKTSAEARPLVRNPLTMLFIDGAHDYDSVRQDFELWAPDLLPGGTLAFHDTPWPGVRQALAEVLSTGKYKDAFFTDTLFFIRKTAAATARDKIRTALMFKLSQVFHAVNASSRPKWLKTQLKSLVKLGRFLINPRPFQKN